MHIYWHNAQPYPPPLPPHTHMIMPNIHTKDMYPPTHVGPPTHVPTNNDHTCTPTWHILCNMSHVCANHYTNTGIRLSHMQYTWMHPHMWQHVSCNTTMQHATLTYTTWGHLHAHNTPPHTHTQLTTGHQHPCPTHVFHLFATLWPCQQNINPTHVYTSSNNMHTWHTACSNTWQLSHIHMHNCFAVMQHMMQSNGNTLHTRAHNHVARVWRIICTHANMYAINNVCAHNATTCTLHRNHVKTVPAHNTPCKHTMFTASPHIYDVTTTNTLVSNCHMAHAWTHTHSKHTHQT